MSQTLLVHPGDRQRVLAFSARPLGPKWRTIGSRPVGDLFPRQRDTTVKPITSCHHAAARSRSETVKSMWEKPLSSGTTFSVSFLLLLSSPQLRSIPQSTLFLVEAQLMPWPVIAERLLMYVACMRATLGQAS